MVTRTTGGSGAEVFYFTAISGRPRERERSTSRQINTRLGRWALVLSLSIVIIDCPRRLLGKLPKVIRVLGRDENMREDKAKSFDRFEREKERTKEEGTDDNRID